MHPQSITLSALPFTTAPDPELWMYLPGHEAHYAVSSHGRVCSVGRWRNGKRGQLLRPMRTHPEQSYEQVAIYVNGRRWYQMVHRLVLLAFEGPLPPGREVNHIDGDAGNNHRSNLEYVTRSENIKHAFRIGHMDVRGARNPAARLTAAQVVTIRARLAAREATGVALAQEYGVASSTISFIKRGQTWRTPA